MRNRNLKILTGNKNRTSVDVRNLFSQKINLSCFFQNKETVSDLQIITSEIERIITGLGRNIADKGRNIADKGRNIADKGRNIADKRRNIADKGRNIADKGRNIADVRINTKYKGENTAVNIRNTAYITDKNLKVNNCSKNNLNPELKNISGEIHSYLVYANGIISDTVDTLPCISIIISQTAESATIICIVILTYSGGKSFVIYWNFTDRTKIFDGVIERYCGVPP